MDRAVSPVVAVVLLLLITVVGTAGVASVAMGMDATQRADGTDPTLAASAVAADQRITLVHRGGDALDLRNCSLVISIDGEPLAHQPPVPYFAAEGFRGTPTGAFNVGGDPVLDPGERASLQLASTNSPQLAAGDRVTVRIRRQGRLVASIGVRAS